MTQRDRTTTLTRSHGGAELEVLTGANPFQIPKVCISPIPQLISFKDDFSCPDNITPRIMWKRRSQKKAGV